MKTNKLNDIVDNIILVTLLFVPFVILFIIECFKRVIGFIKNIIIK